MSSKTQIVSKYYTIPLSVLFSNLVRFVWNPRRIGSVNKIGSIRNRFLRVLAFKLNKTNVPIIERLTTEYSIEAIERRL